MNAEANELLGHSDTVVQINVLHRVQKRYAVGHRLLERFTAGNQAHAAGPFVDDGGFHGFLHVVKSIIEYKAPARFDWELDVGARVARIGNSSLTFELAIFRKGGNGALVTGEIVWVNTNQQTYRPVPISKAIRERIAAREKHLGV